MAAHQLFLRAAPWGRPRSPWRRQPWSPSLVTTRYPLLWNRMATFPSLRGPRAACCPQKHTLINSYFSFWSQVQFKFNAKRAAFLSIQQNKSEKETLSYAPVPTSIKKFIKEDKLSPSAGSHTTFQVRTRQSRQPSPTAAKSGLQDAFHKRREGSCVQSHKQYKTTRPTLRRVRRFQNPSIINEQCTT